MAREYPDAPVVGIGGVVIDGDRVVLVKRAHPPRQGEWSLPGGRLELGESLIEGVRREVLEETGLVVEPGPVVEVFDRVHRDPDGRVRFHFVIVDVLCRPLAGVLAPGDDALDAVWAAPTEVAAYGVNRHAAAVIAAGFRMRPQTWIG